MSKSVPDPSIALLDEVGGFFDDFVEAFSSFSGARIATRYFVPGAAPRGDGSIQCLQSRVEDLDVVPTGGRSALGTAACSGSGANRTTWSGSRQAGRSLLPRTTSARRGRWAVLAVLLAVAVPAGAPGPAEAQADERSTVLHKKLVHGEYVQYLPRQAPKGILVIAHGSTEAGEDVAKLAETFLQRWVKFADEHRLVAVAPVFDANFGSWEKEPGIALGGYRGLAGKQIGADEFVHHILEQYRHQVGSDGRFYLYGHSAGAQFAGRYAIRHPDRLRAAVLSAPGRYAFPDPGAPWPYGQKEVSVRANPSEPARMIRPDPEGWRKAAALPITVVVGTADTEPQPSRPGHLGKTRVEFAQQWVEAMTRVAPQGGTRVRLLTVPRVGHDSARLTSACQEVLARHLGS